MRLGKMCGLLMKAFLAVLMLFVTAAAVEVYWEDEFDEAIANQCESIILKEEYLNMDFGEAIVVDFDTVLDLDGHEAYSLFQNQGRCQNDDQKWYAQYLCLPNYRSLRQR